MKIEAKNDFWFDNLDGIFIDEGGGPVRVYMLKIDNGNEWLEWTPKIPVKITVPPGVTADQLNRLSFYGYPLDDPFYSLNWQVSSNESEIESTNVRLYDTLEAVGKMLFKSGNTLYYLPTYTTKYVSPEEIRWWEQSYHVTWDFLDSLNTVNVAGITVSARLQESLHGAGTTLHLEVNISSSMSAVGGIITVYPRFTSDWVISPQAVTLRTGVRSYRFTFPVNQYGSPYGGDLSINIAYTPYDTSDGTEPYVYSNSDVQYE